MITVIDAPCGTGKTHKAIEYMKSNFLSKDMTDVYKRLYKQYKNR